MQFAQRILEKVTNGIMDYFFTVTYMVRVMFHHTKVAEKVLMCWTEKIGFFVWMLRAINLWVRKYKVLNMLVDLKLRWLDVSNLLTMIRLAKAALKLPFYTDASLIALIHISLYTF
jgi:hypothetical protein